MNKKIGGLMCGMAFSSVCYMQGMLKNSELIVPALQKLQLATKDYVTSGPKKGDIFDTASQLSFKKNEIEQKIFLARKEQLPFCDFKKWDFFQEMLDIPYGTIGKIDEKLEQRITGKSWESSCPIPLSDLRYLTIPYWGYDNQIHIGEMIVHKSIAQEVLDIFYELLENKFPIQSMRLIDDYFQPHLTKGDVDDLSMLNNNSSAFFFRYIGKTNIVSEHGLGTAIDINPLVNPMVKGEKVFPSISREFCERTRKDVKGFLTEYSICVKIFKKYGWHWAGDWKKIKDYQHFCKNQTESLQ